MLNRYTELKRKTPLARSTKPLKRTPMNKVSPKHRQRAKVARERYEDSRGVPFDKVALVLGSDKSLWPKAQRVTHSDSLKVLGLYRWLAKPCPLCRRVRNLEPHHLIGGSAGRSNEHANLIAICRECHDEVQSDSRHTARVWRAKWECDRWHTDWCRLCCLLGRVPFTSLD